MSKMEKIAKSQIAKICQFGRTSAPTCIEYVNEEHPVRLRPLEIGDIQSHATEMQHCLSFLDGFTLRSSQPTTNKGQMASILQYQQDYFFGVYYGLIAEHLKTNTFLMSIGLKGGCWLNNQQSLLELDFRLFPGVTSLEYPTLIVQMLVTMAFKCLHIKGILMPCSKKFFTQRSRIAERCGFQLPEEELYKKYLLQDYVPGRGAAETERPFLHYFLTPSVCQQQDWYSSILASTYVANDYTRRTLLKDIP